MTRPTGPPSSASAASTPIREQPTPTVGSLCSGYGGLDLGLALAIGPVTHAWHVEYDKAPSAILAHHWPAVPNYGDLTTLDYDQMPRVDWLTAGYPCQPFSHAGKRKGTDDERHLWPYVASAIGALRPRNLLLENVRGHVSLGLDAVLGDLAALGYDSRWGVVRASDAGAPHGRARIFIVATDTRRDECGDGPRLTGVVGGAEAARTGEAPERERVRNAARDRRTAASDARDDRRGGNPERHGEAVRPRLEASQRYDPDGGPVPTPADPDSLGHEGLGAAWDWRFGSEDNGEPAPDTTCDGWVEGRSEPARQLGGPDVAECGSAATADPDDPDWGRSHSLGSTLGRDAAASGGESGVEWGAYAPAIRRWEAITGRDAPRPTERGRTGERLSPRFVEWMMGLPAGWVTDVPGLARNAQLKALGNGVVPQQAALTLRLLGVTAEQAAA